ncbi:hypothetical protein C0W44_05220 [Photobacterium leiognathi subsp. mandapamensis]|nr:hypothetical protein C0W44_05220 [Photobacterium leiognathi subsp. mandapamensis]
MKKVLFVGFYDDYARFYSSVSKEISKHLEIESFFWYFNISGYLYGKLHGQNSHLINVESYFSNIVGDDKIDKIKQKRYLEYNKKCEKLTHKIEGKLITKANNYYHYISNLLDEINVDIIIMPGDCRMLEQIIIDLASVKGIEVVYFEQGPYGTTIIDQEGVNSFCSFRYNNKIVNKYLDTKFEKPQKSEKYKRNYIYRAFDKVVDRCFKSFDFYPYDNREYLLDKTISKRDYDRIKEITNDNEFILVILQVPHDANFTHHNPFFSSHLELVESVYRNRPKNIKIVVREHPLYKRRYEKELYDFISKEKDIFLDKSGSVDDIINESSLVIVNNSTSGLDALSQYKKVIVFGNSYYDQAPCVFKVKSLNSLDLFISSVMNSKLDHNLVNGYLNSLIYDNLLPGHYRDRVLTVSKLVAKKIVKMLG